MKIRKCVVCDEFFEALSDKEEICRDCSVYVEPKSIDYDEDKNEDEDEDKKT